MAHDKLIDFSVGNPNEAQRPATPLELMFDLKANWPLRLRR
ncbi:hypothetical protein GGR95_002509 [Sulfitobacter undariae]|uniref:Uncharacterized protein n=1 Tax=Sulfitobacter undariae TaxID=1563671 RepID=A0A7W6EA61_9RHOB|nr:hypothetical protein [Sulfitobacter undariae]